MAEWDGEALARLRSAVHRGDVDAGLDVLRERPLAPVLQYAGDVAVAAVAQGRIEGTWLAAECRALLAERALPGDEVLAAELAAPPEHGAALVPLPVDLGAVAAAMDDGLHVLDLERGDVLPLDEVLFDEVPDDEPQNAGRWLPIPPAVLPEGEDARRGAGRAWLAGQGYRPAPRTL
ncbi:hypothetical protein BZB76_1927 [Actinomadura pelletieri DSM 43383]|uniref:Uncharacterized protein n=1 Tax=Actinomadura pelletieri DSM 43383 TaxID=1120940 RepID=A0A495QT45_9ACTN|nr:hypothetical protein [Actinomadura pelletieri]RKS76571.1 hypothetical protein BZB76_1927 [Actinomadura pelletieri DSM 43383]